MVCSLLVTSDHSRTVNRRGAVGLQSLAYEFLFDVGQNSERRFASRSKAIWVEPCSRPTFMVLSLSGYHSLDKKPHRRRFQSATWPASRRPSPCVQETFRGLHTSSGARIRYRRSGSSEGSDAGSYPDRSRERCEFRNTPVSRPHAYRNLRRPGPTSLGKSVS